MGSQPSTMLQVLFLYSDNPKLALEAFDHTASRDISNAGFPTPFFSFFIPYLQVNYTALLRLNQIFKNRVFS